MGSRTPSSCSPTWSSSRTPSRRTAADLSEAQQLELAAPSPAWSLLRFVVAER